MLVVFLFTKIVSAQLNLLCGRSSYSESTGELKSPGYTLGQYPSNIQCSYTIFFEKKIGHTGARTLDIRVISTTL